MNQLSCRPYKEKNNDDCKNQHSYLTKLKQIIKKIFIMFRLTKQKHIAMIY